MLADPNILLPAAAGVWATIMGASRSADLPVGVGAERKPGATMNVARTPTAAPIRQGRR